MLSRIGATDCGGERRGPQSARTESVAAPVARHEGTLVPRLVAFDDSGAIVDRPYSLWERIHGETLGLSVPIRHCVPKHGKL